MLLGESGCRQHRAVSGSCARQCSIFLKALPSVARHSARQAAPTDVASVADDCDSASMGMVLSLFTSCRVYPATLHSASPRDSALNASCLDGHTPTDLCCFQESSPRIVP